MTFAFLFRFTRTDEKPPTLTLSESAMELGTKIFSSGKYRIPRHFEELTREHLCTPRGQHEKLTNNLTPEQLMDNLEKTGDYKPVFTLRNQLIKLGKDVRVSIVSICND